LNKHLHVFFVFVVLAAGICRAHDLRIENSAAHAAFSPGRLLGAPTQEREAAFRFAWRYRAITYELHYDAPAALARTVYGLALHAGDIDGAMTPDLFIRGVLGYHYSLDQVCSWLNDMLDRKNPDTALDEAILVGMLLQDGILRIKDGRFQSTGLVGHVLAAAPGKKRQFDANLRHERLHVFWDEDADFREQSRQDWKNLSESERAQALKSLARYASGNEKQLIEEWAIARAESSNMHIE
jgi:hypothetical protein